MSDVLSKIGGIRSIIAPVFNFIIPLMMLYFLVSLVEIIHEYIQKSAIDEAKMLIRIAQRQFKQLLILDQKKKVIIRHASLPKIRFVAELELDQLFE